jgi:DNA-binding response OmpR family regulator
MQNRKRALVVEDDIPIRILVMKTLERAGFSAEGAEDGGVAIEKIGAEKYDVVVLDMMMPRVDGFGVLDYLNAEQPQQLQHIIIATALPMTELRSRLQYEVCNILPKPFDLEELVQSARNCSELPQ